MFNINGGVVYTGDYSAMYLTNYGYISAMNFRCLTVSNSGTINTNRFKSDILDNSGTVHVTDFNCKDTINSGTINLYQVGDVNLGKFKLIKNGVLNFNDILIKADEPLDPKVKSYLEKSMEGFITCDESGIVLNGLFYFDPEEVRKELPHLYSKFIEASSGYETLPGAWFSSRYPRLYSISAQTGEKEFWRFKAIDEKYTLSTATTDVFTGLLSSKLLGPDIGREARFDVFAKAIVYKDIDIKQSEILSEDDKKNQILQQYIISEMTKPTVDFINSINNLCQDKQKIQDESGMLSWIYNKISSVFYEQSPHMPIDTIRDEITAEQVLTQINKLLEQMVDVETICLTVKNEIVEDFKAVNCRYSQQQIEEEILPQTDALILNFTNNILAMKEYLELNSAKVEYPRLVLR